MAVGKFDVIEQYLDNNGALLNGGLIYTYTGGTTTPLATYTTSTGGTPHANPIVLDSSGRPPGDGIWFTKGTAYKVVIKTSAGVTLETVDNLQLDDVSSLISAASIGNSFEDAFFYSGAPNVSNAVLYYTPYVRDVVFAANFVGCRAIMLTAPTSDYVATISDDGTTIGTITWSAGQGTGAFATTGGASKTVADGSKFKVLGPASADATAANIGVRWKGALG